MHNLKESLVVVPALVCLLVAGGRGLHAAGTKLTGDTPGTKMQSVALSLDSMDGLEMQVVNGEGATPVEFHADIAGYRGRRAVRIVDDDGVLGTVSGGQVLAIVKTSDFKDGSIEAEVAAFPREGARSDTRGFVGLAFPCSSSWRAV
jgi:hypothetical protein